MQALQGRDPQEMIDAPFQRGPKRDMEAIVAYVVTLSKGDKRGVEIIRKNFGQSCVEISYSISIFFYNIFR
jgi:hypothetical protein